MKNLLYIFLLSFSAVTFASGVPCEDGYVRNPNGRCVLTNQAVQINVGAQACDDKTGEEKLECMKNQADQAVTGQSYTDEDGNQQTHTAHISDSSKASEKRFNQDFSGTVARYGMPALATTYAGLYFLRNRKDLNQCASVSMGFLLAGAATNFVTEYLALKKYKDGVSSAQSAYEDEASNAEESDEAGAYSEIQVQAFNYMIAQEQAKIDALIKRKNGYRIASIAYYAASAAAIVEAIKNSGKCTRPKGSKTKKNKKTTSFSEMDEYSKSLIYALVPETLIYQDLSFKEVIDKVSNKLLNEVGISSAKAQFIGDDHEIKVNKDVTDSTDLTKLISHSNSINLETASDGALNDTRNWIDKSIDTPYARIILSGTLAAYAEIMISKTKKHILTSEARRDAMITARDEYDVASNSSMSLCTSEMRDDKTKPQCYCYLEGGKKNPVRVNRPECKSLGNNYAVLKPTDYNNVGRGTASSTNVCLTSENKFEEGCKSCKANKKYCTLIPNNFSRIGLGGSKWASQAAKMLDKYNNGGLSSEEFNAANPGNLALRLRDLNRRMLEKEPKIKKVTDNVSNKLIASNAKAFDKMIASNPGVLAATSSSGNTPISLKTKSNKKDNILANVRAKFNSSPNAKKIAKEESDLDFSFGADSTAGITINDDLSMNDEYKIIGDINTNSSQNIFRILSNRYQASALRRLFDDKNLTQAPEASESDINEQ